MLGCWRVQCTARVRGACVAVAVAVGAAGAEGGGAPVVPPIAACDSSLSKTDVLDAPLVNRIMVTPDTARLRFQLPRGGALEHEVSSYVVAVADIGGTTVERPYTPVTPPSTNGFFDLVVKGYDKGKMSRHLLSVDEGTSVGFKGPFPKIVVEPNSKRFVTLIAGGSGITPLYQVLNQLLSDPRDRTQVTLVFANRTEDDIIMKLALDRLESAHCGRLQVRYILSRPAAGWDGLTGRLNRSTLKKLLKPPSDKHLVLVCGPPGMLKSLCGTSDPAQPMVGGALAGLGYTPSQVYRF